MVGDADCGGDKGIGFGRSLNARRFNVMAQGSFPLIVRSVVKS